MAHKASTFTVQRLLSCAAVCASSVDKCKVFSFNVLRAFKASPPTRRICFCQILEALESEDENDEQEVEQSVDTTYDHPEHVVTVTTISDVNLDSGKFACIGPNRVSNKRCGILSSVPFAKTLNNYKDSGLTFMLLHHRVK